jgi:putative membrane protein
LGHLPHADGQTVLRILLAALHLLALGIGLGAVWARGRALDSAARSALTPDRLRPAFAADNWWGLAALLWLVTGLWRALAGTEKTPTYYAHNDVFWLKMVLFVTVLLLEIRPMVTLIRWRAVVRRGATPPDNPRTAASLAKISYAEAALVVLIVIAAVSMARGYGARG